MAASRTIEQIDIRALLTSVHANTLYKAFNFEEIKCDIQNSCAFLKTLAVLPISCEFPLIGIRQFEFKNKKICIPQGKNDNKLQQTQFIMPNEITMDTYVVRIEKSRESYKTRYNYICEIESIQPKRPEESHLNQEQLKSEVQQPSQEIQGISKKNVQEPHENLEKAPLHLEYLPIQQAIVEICEDDFNLKYKPCVKSLSNGVIVSFMHDDINPMRESMAFQIDFGRNPTHNFICRLVSRINPNLSRIPRIVLDNLVQLAAQEAQLLANEVLNTGQNNLYQIDRKSQAIGLLFNPDIIDIQNTKPFFYVGNVGKTDSNNPAVYLFRRASDGLNAFVYLEDNLSGSGVNTQVFETILYDEKTQIAKPVLFGRSGVPTAIKDKGLKMFLDSIEQTKESIFKCIFHNLEQNFSNMNSEKFKSCFAFKVPISLTCDLAGREALLSELVLSNSEKFFLGNPFLTNESSTSNLDHILGDVVKTEHGGEEIIVPFTKELYLNLVEDLLDFLFKCAFLGISHGDLHSKNILFYHNKVNNRYTFKVIDFDKTNFAMAPQIVFLDDLLTISGESFISDNFLRGGNKLQNMKTSDKMIHMARGSNHTLLKYIPYRLAKKNVLTKKQHNTILAYTKKFHLDLCSLKEALNESSTSILVLYKKAREDIFDFYIQSLRDIFQIKSMSAQKERPSVSSPIDIPKNTRTSELNEKEKIKFNSSKRAEMTEF